MSSRSLVCITILVLMFCVAAFAQVTTADIVGRVTDTSGAVLPGVTVTAENLAPLQRRTLLRTAAAAQSPARRAIMFSTCFRSVPIQSRSN